MATKYVSALDGGQMDSALMDMATHTSEAWAVGTRNGQAVSASDVTYHNNAKYYSDKVSTDTQRAEDAAARAEAAVPAGTAGAVFFDRAQSLTDAQKGQAKANIGAGGTNPNLLDNPFFTIRQRGDGAFTSLGYTVDRWTQDANMTTTGTADGVQFSTTTTYRALRQKIETPTRFANKTVTISADIVSITGNFYVSAYTGSTLIQRASLSVGMNSVTITAPATGISEILFTNYATASTTAVIRSAKLELGTYSTLANDAPPDYGTELLKCQYRCVVYNLPKNCIFCRGIATSTTNIRAVIDLPTNLANSAFTITSTTNLSTPQGNTITAISYSSTLPRNNKIVVDCTSTGLTSGNVYDVFTSQQTPQIIISADL